ncbi:MAG: thioredoxin family protein [Firmicutes bacterium]|nr:thioredoxin family protein [Bacillota bacterium]
MIKRILTIVLASLLLIGCTNSQPLNDAQLFKQEYETINGTIREKDGNTIREISIPEDNPMVISNAEEVLEKMENKDSLIIYFGFPSCPWCRSVLPTFLESAKENKISRVYYVDVEKIRDTLTMDGNNQVQVEEKGSEAYYQLLEKLASVLDDYTLTNEQEEEISTGEKRIYAPNFVIVLEGKPIYKMEGQSSLQSDGYMELSEEMKQDMKSQFEKFFKILKETSTACESKC